MNVSVHKSVNICVVSNQYLLCQTFLEIDLQTNVNHTMYVLEIKLRFSAIEVLFLNLLSSLSILLYNFYAFFLQLIITAENPYNMLEFTSVLSFFFGS